VNFKPSSIQSGSAAIWGNASNWKPGVVPDNNPFNTFAVTIDSIGLDEIEVYLREDRTIDRLDCHGEVSLEPSTLSRIALTLIDVNGLTNHGELSLAGYTQQIEIRGNVTNSQEAMLGLGCVEIHGTLRNLAGGAVEVEAWNDIHNGGLENDGLLVVLAASDILVDEDIQNGGIIRLYGAECGTDEVFDNQSGGIVRGFGIIEAGHSIQNSGKMIPFGGPLMLRSDGPFVNTGTIENSPSASLHVEPAADVNNLGTIKVNAGGGVTFGCTLTNEPNATIELRGGALGAQKITQKAGAEFKGQGHITSDVVLEPNAIVHMAGPANIFGSVQIDRSATLEISDGTTLITGYTTCNGTIHMKGGRIIPQGGLSGDCNIIWEPGTYTNGADFNLDGRVNFEDFTDFADTWLWQADWHAP